MPMEQLSTNESEPTFRLTLRWVILAVGLLFAVGVLGGMLGQWLVQPPLPPLSPTEERLVTTVQEVTISPNTAAAAVVSTVSRSVVLLATRSGTTLQPRGSAVVLTNDGLVATTATLPEADVVALDDGGSVIMLDRVGRDELYGISYFRMPNSVMVPLDLRRDVVSVGTELLTISRSEVTRQIKVLPYTVQEFSVPQEGESRAIQRVWLGSRASSILFIGAPLVDEAGRLAGLLVDQEGRAVGADVIELSLRRISEGQREFDPLAQLGLTLQFSFVPTADNTAVLFTPRVTAVSPGTPAGAAGLQRGDVLLSINDEAVAWERNVVQQLSGSLPVRLTIQRGLEEVVVTLQKVAAPE